ncbi:MAG: glycosyltransferase family 39 protein [Candidatus Blackburnbacteria bacterium]|nr:glycosyltransferase family 39 protein [Candidatus Blackburnbacteria bacterium]
MSNFQFPADEKWRGVIFWGTVILLVAVFLRTYNIFSIPIFADEAIYIRWAQVMRAVSTLRFLPLDDGKQPLFMWLTIPFLKVIDDPLVAGRALSVLAGLGTLTGIFFVTLRLFKDKKMALLAALVYAVSPFTVFFDRMALVDSLLMCFGVWSLYFGILTAQELRLDWAMLTGFALGFAYLTKSPGMFFLLLLPSTLLLGGFRGKGRWGKLGKLGALWLVSWAIALGMYNILRLGPNFHMLALRNKDYVYSFSEVLRHPLDPIIPHFYDLFDWFSKMLPITVLLIAVLGVVLALKKDWRQLLLLLGWSIGPLVIEAAFAKVFTARYVLFTLPPILIMAAYAWGKFKNKNWLTLGGAFIVLPSLFINYRVLTNPAQAPLPREERSGYLEEWTAGTGIREIAQYVKTEKEQNPNQKILVGTEGFFGTLPDGLQIYLSDIPGIVVKGVGITIYNVDQSLSDAQKAGDTVFLVVNSTRFKIEQPEKVGLRLVNSYPKAQRANGTQESLLLLELIK